MSVKSVLLTLSWLILLLSHLAVDAREVPGRLLRVIDGDTLEIQTAQEGYLRVRLAGIDAPEKSQAFGRVAGAKLRVLTMDKPLRVQVLKTDRYGRSISHVYAGQEDVGLTMVKDGYAWHFKRFECDQTRADRARYADAEQAARRSRRGLWEQPDPTPPWKFRKPRGRTPTQEVKPKC